MKKHLESQCEKLKLLSTKLSDQFVSLEYTITYNRFNHDVHVYNLAKKLKIKMTSDVSMGRLTPDLYDDRNSVFIEVTSSSQLPSKSEKYKGHPVKLVTFDQIELTEDFGLSSLKKPDYSRGSVMDFSTSFQNIDDPSSDLFFSSTSYSDWIYQDPGEIPPFTVPDPKPEVYDEVLSVFNEMKMSCGSSKSSKLVPFLLIPIPESTGVNREARVIINNITQVPDKPKLYQVNDERLIMEMNSYKIHKRALDKINRSRETLSWDNDCSGIDSLVSKFSTVKSTNFEMDDFDMDSYTSAFYSLYRKRLSFTSYSLQYAKFLSHIHRDLLYMSNIKAKQNQMLMNKLHHYPDTYIFMMPGPKLTSRGTTRWYRVITSDSDSGWRTVHSEEIEHYMMCYYYLESITRSLVLESDVKLSDSDRRYIFGFLPLIVFCNSQKLSQMLLQSRYLCMTSLSKFKVMTPILRKLNFNCRYLFHLWILKKLESNLNPLMSGDPEVEIKLPKRNQWGDLESKKSTCSISCQRPFFEGKSRSPFMLLTDFYLGYLVQNKPKNKLMNLVRCVNKLSEMNLRYITTNPCEALGKIDDNFSRVYSEPRGQIPHTFSESFVVSASKHFVKTHVITEDSFLEKLKSLRTFQSVIKIANFRGASSDDEPNRSEMSITGIIKLLRKHKKIRISDLAQEIISSDEPYCMRLADKIQYGSERELMVQTSKTKVANAFCEGVFEGLSKYLVGEMMTKSNKRDLQLEYSVDSDSNPSLCLNHDNSKWGPNMMMSQFICMTKGLTEILGPQLTKLLVKHFIKMSEKRVYIPNKVYKMWKSKEFMPDQLTPERRHLYNETVLKGRNYIIQRENMGQGILHFTSSFYHGICLEYYQHLKSEKFKSLYSSDDRTSFHHSSTDPASVVKFNNELSYLSNMIPNWSKSSLSNISEFNSCFGFGLSFSMPSVCFMRPVFEMRPFMTLRDFIRIKLSDLSNCMNSGLNNSASILVECYFKRYLRSIIGPHSTDIPLLKRLECPLITKVLPLGQMRDMTVEAKIHQLPYMKPEIRDLRQTLDGNTPGFSNTLTMGLTLGTALGKIINYRDRSELDDKSSLILKTILKLQSVELVPHDGIPMREEDSDFIEMMTGMTIMNSRKNKNYQMVFKKNKYFSSPRFINSIESILAFTMDGVIDRSWITSKDDLLYDVALFKSLFDSIKSEDYVSEIRERYDLMASFDSPRFVSYSPSARTDMQMLMSEASQLDKNWRLSIEYDVPDNLFTSISHQVNYKLQKSMDDLLAYSSLGLDSLKSPQRFSTSEIVQYSRKLKSQNRKAVMFYLAEDPVIGRHFFGSLIRHQYIQPQARDEYGDYDILSDCCLEVMVGRSSYRITVEDRKIAVETDEFRIQAITTEVPFILEKYLSIDEWSMPSFNRNGRYALASGTLVMVESAEIDIRMVEALSLISKGNLESSEVEEPELTKRGIFIGGVRVCGVPRRFSDPKRVISEYNVKFGGLGINGIYEDFDKLDRKYVRWLFEENVIPELSCDDPEEKKVFSAEQADAFFAQANLDEVMNFDNDVMPDEFKGRPGAYEALEEFDDFKEEEFLDVRQQLYTEARMMLLRKIGNGGALGIRDSQDVPEICWWFIHEFRDPMDSLLWKSLKRLSYYLKGKLVPQHRAISFELGSRVFKLKRNKMRAPKKSRVFDIFEPLTS